MKTTDERKMYQEMKETLKVMKLRAEIVESKYKEMYYTAGIFELQNKYPQLFSDDPTLKTTKEESKQPEVDPNIIATFQEKIASKIEEIKKSEEVKSQTSITTEEVKSEQPEPTILNIHESK